MDITERTNGKTPLRKARNFSATFSSPRGGQIDSRPGDGRHRRRQQYRREILRMVREQLLTMKIFDINTLTQAGESGRHCKRSRIRNARAFSSVTAGRTAPSATSKFSATGSMSRKPLLHSIITDISERKAAEIRMLQINEELEQKVQQRTAELTRIHRPARGDQPRLCRPGAENGRA